MTSRTWIIFAAIVVVLFGGLVYLSLQNKTDVSSVDHARVQPASDASGNIADHVFGSDAQKVVLIEYGDFQCPGCGRAYEPTKEMVEKYEDHVTFVFRNFPLTSIHPNARAAAAAAEAAGLMGSYWPMHDKLFESQNEWQAASPTDRTELFVNYAISIGLDAEIFRDKFTNETTAINKKIDFDRALGRKAGVDSTPTFYINGEKVTATTDEGADVWNDAEQFEKKVLLPAFNKAGITLPKE